MFNGFGLRPVLKVLVVAGLASLLAACTSTGNSFNTTASSQLVVGETTMADAVRILGAEPVNTYRQLDGSATSIWSQKKSVLTDAIYLNQELWLAFGTDGRFQRIVKKHNLPVAAAPAADKKAAAPVQQAMATTTPVAAPVNTLASTPNTTPVILPAAVVEVAPTPPALVIDKLNINQPVVAYPVHQ